MQTHNEIAGSPGFSWYPAKMTMRRPNSSYADFAKLRRARTPFFLNILVLRVSVCLFAEEIQTHILTLLRIAQLILVLRFGLSPIFSACFFAQPRLDLLDSPIVVAEISSRPCPATRHLHGNLVYFGAMMIYYDCAKRAFRSHIEGVSLPRPFVCII